MIIRKNKKNIHYKILEKIMEKKKITYWIK